MCENHQICRADFGKTNPRFFGTPPALKCTHEGGAPLVAGFKGAQAHRHHRGACMASAWA